VVKGVPERTRGCDTHRIAVRALMFRSSGEIVGRSGSGTHRDMLTNREFLLSSTRHVFARRFATEPQDSKARSGSFPLTGGRLGWGSSASLRVSTPIPTFPLRGGRRLILPKDAARGVPREDVVPTNFAEEPNVLIRGDPRHLRPLQGNRPAGLVARLPVTSGSGVDGNMSVNTNPSR